MNSRTVMLRFLAAALRPIRTASAAASLALVGMLLVLLTSTGCRPEPDIVQYTIDTREPEELQVEQRLIGAIVPHEDAVWFFKVVGPADDVEPVADEIRDWVAAVPFEAGEPVLELPEQWTRREGGAMRFATIEIPAGDLPLEMSVSKLARGDDWDALVAMNVNRWRAQMGLEPAEEPFAGAVPLAGDSDAGDSDAGDSDAGPTAMWVDLSGTFGGGPSGAPPMAGGAPFAGAATGVDSPLMSAGPLAGPLGGAADGGQSAAPSSAVGGEESQTQTDAVTYDTPAGWRPGRMSAMRWAAFNVGPEDRAAELTVIPAGGDTRGNVKRWLGQIRPEGVDDALLDAVIAEAEEVTVDGRTAQRFLLSGSGEKPLAIDATIVPLEEGRSLFIKLTGDAETVAEESDEVGQFLESFQINR